MTVSPLRKVCLWFRFMLRIRTGSAGPAVGPTLTYGKAFKFATTRIIAQRANYVQFRAEKARFCAMRWLRNAEKPKGGDPECRRRGGQESDPGSGTSPTSGKGASPRPVKRLGRAVQGKSTGGNPSQAGGGVSGMVLGTLRC